MAHVEHETRDHTPRNRGHRAFAQGRRRSDGAHEACLPEVSTGPGRLQAAGWAALALGVAGGVKADSPAQWLASLPLWLAAWGLGVALGLAILGAARRRLGHRPERLQVLAGGLAMALVAMLTASAIHLLAQALPARVLTPEAARDGGSVAWLLVQSAGVGFIAGAFWVGYRALRVRADAPSFAEARLQALQARIRPHFLFNTLNTVLALLPGDPARARVTLENLACLLRAFMRDTAELVPLRDEIELCQSYLQIESLRLGDRLVVRWSPGLPASEVLVPALLLQPLAENAIRHGLETSEVPGRLTIRIAQEGARLRIEMTNPVSRHPSLWPGGGMALANLRERLMLLYDRQAELRTEVRDERFCVQIDLPCRTEKRRVDARRAHHPDRR